MNIDLNGEVLQGKLIHRNISSSINIPQKQSLPIGVRSAGSQLKKYRKRNYFTYFSEIVM